jgi:hypothetical protein
LKIFFIWVLGQYTKVWIEMVKDARDFDGSDEDLFKERL